MPTRKKAPARRASAAREASLFPGERELIVVMQPEASVRASLGMVATAAGPNVRSLNALLKANDATLVPIFGNEDRVVRATTAASFTAPAAGVPELTTFYRVAAPDAKLDTLAKDLLNHNLVNAAFVRPQAEPPIDIQADMPPPAAGEAPPVSPDFTASQLYLDPAPGGIDARFAWTVAGGKGQGVQIVDIEGAWRFTHEDLLQNQGGVIGGTQSTDIGWRNHGTAVTGEFGGDENTFGITGICSLANVRAIAIFGPNQGAAKAITDAANALNPGDIILIELHAPGPHFNFQAVNGQAGYIAMEFWPDIFAAIVYATSVRGVIVVEAGGNGSENFDDPLYNTTPAGWPASWTNPFNLANPQSGAIIVGAGAPPPGTHGSNWGADRSRLDFSNYGARVDVQGWGREVTTTGYGDLQGGGNEDLWYTQRFSGTSSASPIIVGTVGCLQGALRGAGKTLLTPATARNVLRTTGSPQQDEPGRPATQRIGNRPDLKAALNSLGIGGKTVIKDLKDKREKLEKREKSEKPEKREKLEKPEKREKLEKFEKREKLEKFEKREKIEVKEKIEKLEAKEKREAKEFKEIRETGGIETGGAPGAEPAGDLESRVSQLEQAVIELTHFISGELRPDLQSAALSQEEDLLAASSQLEKDSADAKAAKDQKDLEKMADR